MPPTPPKQALRKQYHSRLIDGDRHVWDVHRLIRLSRDCPVERIPLSEIAELDSLWWFRDATDRPTPRAIAQHLRLVDQTDLTYPILLCQNGQLMDGMHRVVKALSLGHPDIAAQRLSPTPAPDFINVELATLPYPDETL